LGTALEPAKKKKGSKGGIGRSPESVAGGGERVLGGAEVGTPLASFDQNGWEFSDTVEYGKRREKTSSAN